MNYRERVFCAVSHKRSDEIPHDITWTAAQYQKMAAFYHDENFGEKIGNHIRCCCDDNFYTELKDKKEQFIDKFGVVWDRSGVDKDIGVIHNFVIPEPDERLIRLPEIDLPLLRKNFEDLEKDTEHFRFATISFSLFERAWSLCGMENTLVYMLTEKAFLHRLLDEICERNLKIIELALQYDIDGFHFGDDWGSQRGLIMGKELWREFIKPRLARMYEPIKRKGKIVSQHSCGDIYDVFGDLIDIGLDVYQTFQPEIYDLDKWSANYGKHLTVWGGVSTQRELSRGSVKDVEEATIRLVEKIGQNGGLILAPTHAVPPDCPAENCDKLIEMMLNQEKYFQ